MSSIFRSPPPVVVSTPFQQTSSGSSEIKPYAPVEPFIEQILPEIRQTFTQAPELFTGTLVPGEAAQTLAARDIYGQVGQTAAGLAPQFMQLGQADIAIRHERIRNGLLAAQRIINHVEIANS